MVDTPPASPRPKAPFHLWVVGFLSLVLTAWGGFISIAAQSGTLPNLRPDVQAYFEAQPLWLVLIADAGMLAGIAGSVALLLQHRSAVWLFSAMFVTILFTNLYEVTAGTSPILFDADSVGGSSVAFVLMGLQLLYARAMARQGVLE